MIQQARRPVRRIELIKWCFLLRYESETKGGSTFYDFVPYKFGPYSFSLVQEIEKLEFMKFVVKVDEKSWAIGAGFPTDRIVEGIAPAIERDLNKIVARFIHDPIHKLLDYVYHKYADFTVNSDREKLATRTKGGTAVYTAGYEGLSVDAFLNLLVRCGIERIIDVRSNPIARRFGFHKSTLQRLAGQLAIDYDHFSELGIGSAARRLAPTIESRISMFGDYENITLASEAVAIEAVCRLVSERPSVLICMEADPACCHRSRLAKLVAQMTDLEIIDLGCDP